MGTRGVLFLLRKLFEKKFKTICKQILYKDFQKLLKKRKNGF